MIGQYYEREIWGDVIGPYCDRSTGDEGGERQPTTEEDKSHVEEHKQKRKHDRAPKKCPSKPEKVGRR